MGRAAYYLETDNYSEAIRIGEAGLALADKLGYIAWSLQWILPVVGEAALWSRDFDRAESIRRACDAMRKGSVTVSGSRLPTHATACCFIFRDGNWKDQFHCSKRAITELDTLPMPDAAARVRRALASAFRCSLATVKVRCASCAPHTTRLRDLGAAGELNAVRDELRALGARPPSRTVAPEWPDSQEERLRSHAWSLNANRTRRSGAALDISARTVSTHLSNIFGKVGVASRGELADFVRENLHGHRLKAVSRGFPESIGNRQLVANESDPPPSND